MTPASAPAPERPSDRAHGPGICDAAYGPDCGDCRHLRLVLADRLMAAVKATGHPVPAHIRVEVDVASGRVRGLVDVLELAARRWAATHIAALQSLRPDGAVTLDCYDIPF